MSLSPVTPNFSQSLQGYTPKSFWKRPEGPFGMLVLVALIVGAGIGLYIILPFLIVLLTNTLYAAALVAVLFVILWLAFNPTFRTAVRNLFQNSVRWFASWVVETDPIGILRNNLDDMKKEQADLDQTLQRFAGAAKGSSAALPRRTTRSTPSVTRPPRRSKWRRLPPTRWRRSA